MFGAFFCALLFCFAFNGFSETIYVTNPNDTPSGLKGASGNLSLRQALAVAKPRDTISVKGGEHIVFKKTVLIEDPLTINWHNDIISPDPTCKSFNLFEICLKDGKDGSVTLNNFKMVGNRDIKVKSGAALYIHKKNADVKVNVDSGSISDFDSDCEGVVLNKDSVLSMSNFAISRNTSNSGAQVFNDNGKFTHENTTFENPPGVTTSPISDIGNFAEILKKDKNVTIWLPKKTKQFQQYKNNSL